MLSLNDRVDIPSRFQTNCGRVRYIGKVNFGGDDDARGEDVYGARQSHEDSDVWVGIELDSPWGNTDGSVDGYRYFSCSPGYGLFMPVDLVVRSQASNQPRGWDDRESSREDGLNVSEFAGKMLAKHRSNQGDSELSSSPKSRRTDSYSKVSPPQKRNEESSWNQYPHTTGSAELGRIMATFDDISRGRESLQDRIRGLQIHATGHQHSISNASATRGHEKDSQRTSSTPSMGYTSTSDSRGAFNSTHINFRSSQPQYWKTSVAGKPRDDVSNGVHEVSDVTEEHNGNEFVHSPARQVATKQRQRDKQKKVNQRLMQDLQALQSQLDVYADENRKLRNDLEEAEKYRKKNAKLQRKYRDATAREKEMKSDAKEMKAERESLLTEVEQLSFQVNKLEQQQDSNAIVHEREQNLRKELHETKKQLSLSRQELSRLDLGCHAAEAKSSTEKRKLKSVLHDLSKLCDSARDVIVNAERKAAEAEREKVKLKTDRDNLVVRVKSAAMPTSEKQNGEYHDESIHIKNEALRQEIDPHLIPLGELQRQRKYWESERKDLVDELSTLKEQQRSLEDKNSSLQAREKDDQAAKRTLERQIQELKTELLKERDTSKETCLNSTNEETNKEEGQRTTSEQLREERNFEMSRAEDLVIQVNELNKQIRLLDHDKYLKDEHIRELREELHRIKRENMQLETDNREYAARLQDEELLKHGVRVQSQDMITQAKMEQDIVQKQREAVEYFLEQSCELIGRARVSEVKKAIGETFSRIHKSFEENNHQAFLPTSILERINRSLSEVNIYIHTDAAKDGAPLDQSYECEMLNERVTQLLQENASLKSRIDEIELANSNLISTLDQSEKQLGGLSAVLENTENENDSLREQIARVQHSMQTQQPRRNLVSYPYPTQYNGSNENGAGDVNIDAIIGSSQRRNKDEPRRRHTGKQHSRHSKSRRRPSSATSSESSDESIERSEGESGIDEQNLNRNRTNGRKKGSRYNEETSSKPKQKENSRVFGSKKHGRNSGELSTTNRQGSPSHDDHIGETDRKVIDTKDKWGRDDAYTPSTPHRKSVAFEIPSGNRYDPKKAQRVAKKLAESDLATFLEKETPQRSKSTPDGSTQNDEGPQRSFRQQAEDRSKLMPMLRNSGKSKTAPHRKRSRSQPERGKRLSSMRVSTKTSDAPEQKTFSMNRSNHAEALEAQRHVNSLQHGDSVEEQSDVSSENSANSDPLPRRQPISYATLGYSGFLGLLEPSKHGSTGIVRHNNHDRITSALKNVIFAAEAQQSQFDRAQNAIAKNRDSIIVCIFATDGRERRQFLGLGAMSDDLTIARKIFGTSSCPKTLDGTAMKILYKYDTSTRTFKPLMSSSFTVSTDGIGVDPHHIKVSGLQSTRAPARALLGQGRTLGQDCGLLLEDQSGVGIGGEGATTLRGSMSARIHSARLSIDSNSFRRGDLSNTHAEIDWRKSDDDEYGTPTVSESWIPLTSSPPQSSLYASSYTQPVSIELGTTDLRTTPSTPSNVRSLDATVPQPTTSQVVSENESVSRHESGKPTVPDVEQEWIGMEDDASNNYSTIG
eukprot:gb/GECG01001457.1/.p1 GENE.gb/GECG01001457.1/~~gb/GECG01001457.1/.p1  ORF type:complete len:1561 (+),score=269.21 gb/GECG01001457.1/:1-4683(+)